MLYWPEKKGTSRNTVRIRLSSNDQIVAEYRLRMDRKAEWKDLIKKTTFDLHKWQGQLGYIEVTDSTTTGAIGIGMLEPAVLPMPEVSPGEIAERRAHAVEMAGDLKVNSLEPVLRKLLSSPWADINVRIASAAALMNLSPQRNISYLGTVFNDPLQPAVLRDKVAQALGQSSSPAVYAMLAKGLSGRNYNSQVIIATLLANTSEGAGHLLAAAKAGNIRTADGLKDVLIREGWWENPGNPRQSNWAFHPADLGADCSQMYVLDLNKDGLPDVISASAHNYGIWWHEQLSNGSWKQHEIYKSFSQTHGVALADINGDGYPDIITGKRYFAHNGNDPGEYEPAVLYWFEFKPGSTPTWIPHQVDNDSGVGLHVVVEDMNGDGKPDIVTGNKKGVHLFLQKK